MDIKQVEAIDLITNDMGENIIHLHSGNTERFFVGMVEYPSSEHDYVSLTGKEITHFMKVDAIRLSKEKLQMDLMTYFSNVSQYNITFSKSVIWWVYSRS